MQQHEPSPKGDRRRAQIIDTAVQMFGESGYRGASLRDIANRVGITHPGLLYHFHSKEELLMEVLSRRDEENRARFDPDEQLTPVQRLRGVLELVQHNAERHGMVELFSTLSAEATDPAHPAHTYFTLRYEMVTGSYVALFSDLQRRGRLREGLRPESVAHNLVALLDGLQVQWLYDGRGVDMVTMVAGYLDQVLARPLAELEAEDAKVLAEQVLDADPGEPTGPAA